MERRLGVHGHGAETGTRGPGIEPERTAADHGAHVAPGVDVTQQDPLPPGRTQDGEPGGDGALPDPSLARDEEEPPLQQLDGCGSRQAVLKPTRRSDPSGPTST
jgi:hypothetical protein